MFRHTQMATYAYSFLKKLEKLNQFQYNFTESDVRNSISKLNSNLLCQQFKWHWPLQQKELNIEFLNVLTLLCQNSTCVGKQLKLIM